MRIKNLRGEFYFKALTPSCVEEISGWKLTEIYFESLESARRSHPRAIWPAEEIGDSTVFVPDEEEAQEEKD